MSLQTDQIAAVLKKRPVLAGAVAGIVALAALVYFRSGEIPAQQARIDELRKTRSGLQANITNSAQIARQLEELKKLNEQIAAAAIKPAELARNQQFFYQLESDLGIKLIDVQQSGGGARPNTRFTTLTFTVNLGGDYEKVLAFMRQMERVFLGGRVLTATISPGAATPDGDPELTRQVSITVQIPAFLP